MDAMRQGQINEILTHDRHFAQEASSALQPESLIFALP
jgi:hypothetical protein